MLYRIERMTLFSTNFTLSIHFQKTNFEVDTFLSTLFFCVYY